MPKPTPLVILSQAWDPGDLSELTETYRAVIADGSLTLRDVSASDGPVNEHQIPAQPFAITSTAGSTHDEWVAVLVWLQSSVGENALFVVDYDHPLRELILFGAAALDLRYCLRFATVPSRFSAPLEYAIIGNAEVMLISDPALHDDFRRNYFVPYVSAASLADLRAQDKPVPRGGEPKPAVGTDSSGHPIRVLIVAYFTGPCRTVGVQRPNYWFEALARVSDGAIEVEIVSANDWGEPRADVHVVPDFNVASLLDNDNNYPPWAADFVAWEKRDAKAFNTLSFYWRYALEKYFDAAERHFDVVVISGNPFSCFDFATYAKRRWHARVILDYRDPFGNNPRFKYTPEARQATRYAERGFNFQADVVSVVNDYCIDLVEEGTDAEIVNIPNGFDERILGSVERAVLSSDRINLVHAGSFTHDRSPEFILGALDPERHRFHHVGNSAGVDAQLLEIDSVVAHGMLPYIEALGIMGGADIGVVFLSEQNFETTTKLFDYLAMEIDILLCTNGEVGVGALADVLEGREGVFWCKNTREDALRFLAEYVPTIGRVRSRTDSFSRRHGTELLADKIIELASNETGERAERPS